MNEINPQQILIEQLNKVSNNKELIDLAVTLIESNQNVINFSYRQVEVSFNVRDKSIIEYDTEDCYQDFNDLLSAVAYNNIDKLTVINACQYPDLTEGCVRYLYFSSINVYYKITINQIKYFYTLTKEGYKRYQEFWFNYPAFCAHAWDGDDDRGLVVYGIKPSTAKNAELFVTEEALLNKYPDALKMT